ncbi:MAG: hypothetical protein M3478_12255 [Planctomycetota bacterium]|nr:hypothetical protein [Planctomycetota bacterium]
MRTLLMIAAIVAVPVWANAQDNVQDNPSGNHRGLRSARGFLVAVIDADSHEWQGRLLDVGGNDITVELDALPRRFELTTVKRVDAHGDRVWDGAVKGAIFGGLMGAFALGGRAAASGAVVYGLLGLGVDALNTCHHTVYRAPAVSASVKVLSW